MEIKTKTMKSRKKEEIQLIGKVWKEVSTQKSGSYLTVEKAFSLFGNKLNKSKFLKIIKTNFIITSYMLKDVILKH